MVQQGNYNHLPLPLVIKDRAYLTGGGQTSQTTIANRNNRVGHGGNLRNKATSINQAWHQKVIVRQEEGLPELPRSIPILLEIDPNVDTDFLRSFGFEVISEQEDGFIVIATEDIDMVRFFNNVDKFIQNLPRSGSSAQIHQLHGDENIDVRLQRILSEKIYQEWPRISDDESYTVDIGIECLGNFVIPDPVERNVGEEEERFQLRRSRWEGKVQEVYLQLDELKRERETLLETFINAYGGSIISIFEEGDAITSLSDSFTARVEINGKGLKDIALNFPYVFEVVEPEEIGFLGTQDELGDNFTDEAEVLPPEENAPRVCIIDSGIQEGHRLLNPAVESNMSHCFLPDETDISDRVNGGGHGTRVAGAVLYPNEIPKTGVVTAEFWIQNARVLNERNFMPSKLFPPKLLREIVEKYLEETNTRLYNHSITGFFPFRLKHMSSWPAEMDNLSYQNDILFVQAAGNISPDYDGPFRYGIGQHLDNGRTYPDYLLERSCRIPSPAQSLQAITVGSISHGELVDVDRRTLGGDGWPSAFSATGLGIWDTLKPDVVEYGGTYVIDNGTPRSFTNPPEVCPELIRSSPPAYAKDSIGTSYAAPKVTNLLAHIQKTLPDESTLLYRALLAQSARWPNWASTVPQNEKVKVLRHMGYGVPDVERATLNNPYRVTLITTGRTEIISKEAHVYEVPVPDSIRTAGEEYDILIEITLSYVAKPRRTRKKLRGYLATWLDWKSSNIGESPTSFTNRVLHGRNHQQRDDDSNIPWTIGNRTNTGIDGISRNSGTLQKDWAVIKSHELTNGFNIAVIGHPGWNKDPNIKAFYSLVVSFEAINRDVQIYELIRAEVETKVETETEVTIL